MNHTQFLIGCASEVLDIKGIKKNYAFACAASYIFSTVSQR